MPVAADTVTPLVLEVQGPTTEAARMLALFHRRIDREIEEMNVHQDRDWQALFHRYDIEADSMLAKAIQRLSYSHALERLEHAERIENTIGGGS